MVDEILERDGIKDADGPSSERECPQCKAEYRHIQAPHKAFGVSMMAVCDCVSVVRRAGNLTITTLISPQQLEKEKQIEKIRTKMLKAVPLMRQAVKEAAKKGDVSVGILAVNPDGSGQVVARFDAPGFFEDLAFILGASEDDSVVATLDDQELSSEDAL